MRSIRAKLTLSAVVLLVLFMAGLLISNRLLLERFYVLKTRASFQAVYEEVQSVLPAGPGRLEETVRAAGADSGYKLTIVDRAGKVKFSSAPEFADGRHLNLPREQREFFLEHRPEFDSGRVIYGALEKSSKDEALVQLIGPLDGRDFLVVTQPLKQLRASARIANSFFLVMGLGMLLLAAAAVLLLSGGMIRPILEITNIAAAIAGMDFSRRYAGKSRDELGLLGESINTIAERLSEAITGLRAANEQLRHEMQLQKRFLAGVSHDFKTPVGLIRGYAESLVLGMAKSRKEQKELAGIIIAEADRLDRLVNDITYMVRMDSREVPLHLERQNVPALLQSAAARFSPAAGKGGVRVQIEAEPGLAAEADGQRIMQVLDNLLANALRHTGAEGEVLLEARETEDRILIEIRNTGEPIASEHLPYLFEPFYRVEESRPRQSGGSGLGLAIVKGIVTAHGGECGVRNTPQGVLFWFSLPRARGD